MCAAPATAGAPPRVTGEVRTDEGRYRAWGQMLDVETGLIRFNGPYNNPSLDILALRPNISVRAGVQVSGSALARACACIPTPSCPTLKNSPGGAGPRCHRLMVPGRRAATAALVLLGRRGQSPTGNLASRVGLDEIGFKGAAPGEDANTAALTFGKRISKDLYLTYERTLSGTLGALYIFYDLSRNLTLRGQAGSNSAVDLIYNDEVRLRTCSKPRPPPAASTIPPCLLVVQWIERVPLSARYRFDSCRGDHPHKPNWPPALDI